MNTKKINLSFFLVIISFSFLYSCPDKKTENQKISNTTDIMVLSINDKPIFEKDVMKGIPEDIFGFTRDQAVLEKVNRYKNIILITQLMKDNGIVVSDEEVDDDIAKLKETPPQSSCSCCCYASLEQFMELNYYTLPDLREYSRIILGFDKYCNKLWNQEYSTKEKKDALISPKRHEFKMKYFNAYHIFFNSYQDPDFQNNPKEVISKKKKSAIAAWARLNKGEKFEDVAKEISEDIVSKPKGGYLGCIRGNEFGNEFKLAITELKVGEYSKPVTGIYGVHIIKKEEIGDENILKILKENFISEKQNSIYARLMDESRLEFNETYQWLSEYM